MWTRNRHRSGKPTQGQPLRVEELSARLVPTVLVSDPLTQPIPDPKGSGGIEFCHTPISQDPSGVGVELTVIEDAGIEPTWDASCLDTSWMVASELASDATLSEDGTQVLALDGEKPWDPEVMGSPDDQLYQTQPFFRTFATTDDADPAHADLQGDGPILVTCFLPLGADGTTEADWVFATHTLPEDAAFDLAASGEDPDQETPGLVIPLGAYEPGTKPVELDWTEGLSSEEPPLDETPCEEKDPLALLALEHAPAEWSYRGDGEVTDDSTATEVWPEAWAMTMLPGDQAEIKTPEDPPANEGGENPSDLMFLTGFPDGVGDAPSPTDGAPPTEDDLVVVTALPQEEMIPTPDDRLDGIIETTSAPLTYAVTSLIKGQAGGTYTIEDSLPDAGQEYRLSGTATIAGIGEMAIEGAVRSVGSVRLGQARGMVTLSDAQGSITLALVGEMQVGLSALPSSLTFRVVRGSGAYLAANGFGAFELGLTGNGDWSANLHLDKLVGTGMGTWEIPPQIQVVTDVGTLHTFQGQALVSGLPAMSFTGEVTSTGFVLKGHATGHMTLAGANGTIKLALKGPEQGGFAPLPKTFEATVVEATGQFVSTMETTRIKLLLNPDQSLVCQFTENDIAVVPGENTAREFGLRVDSLYRTYLGRIADQAGRAQWIKVLEGGASTEDVAMAFLLSKEYLDTHGANQESYIRSLYARILGRTASQAEVALWQTNWNQGLSREQIVDHILDSREAGLRSLRNLYRSYMHREADQPGLSNWVSQLEAGRLNLDQIAAKFLQSQEYRAKIGTLPVARPADPAA